MREKDVLRVCTNKSWPKIKLTSGPVFMRARLRAFVRHQYIAKIKGGGGGLIWECVCDSERGTQRVRQQIAVGGRCIVCFVENCKCGNYSCDEMELEMFLLAVNFFQHKHPPESIQWLVYRYYRERPQA